MNNSKTKEKDEHFDAKEHNNLINELINNIFENKDTNYKMSQHEFVKLLIEQIKSDRYFQKDFTEVSSISEVKNDSQLRESKSPLKVDEELQDHVE